MFVSGELLLLAYNDDSKQLDNKRKNFTDKWESQIRDIFEMKCDLCRAVEFKTILEARKHYLAVHKIPGYLICCGGKFYSRKSILSHIHCHKGSGNGPKVLAQMEKAQQNARIREIFDMKCDLCDFEFESLLRAKQHYRKVHNIQGGYLRCCGKKFDKRFGVLDHLRYHTDPDRLRCDQCDKICINRYALKLHKKHHVPLDSRAYKCNLCSSSFMRQCELNGHMKHKHESKTGENFPCEKCGKE